MIRFVHSTPVYVRENAKLTFVSGSEIHFEETGQLIIEDGSKLVLSPFVEIMGKSSENKIQVFGQLEGTWDLPNPPDPIPVENLTLSALTGYSWSGFEFNNPALPIVFDNCSFSDCLLTGVLDHLEIRNGSELTSSFLSLNETNLVVDNSVFTNTAVRLTNYLHEDVSAEITGSEFTTSNRDILLEMDRYPNYYIDDNIIHYDHGIGIGLFHCGAGTGPHTISNNTIEKSGSNQEFSWGVKIYHTFSDLEKNLISNNRYGIVSLNQSSVNLSGDENATIYSGTQQIIDNYQNQVKTYDNSFPLYFHFNIIQNTSNPGNTILIHHDPVSPLPAPIETSYNIKCNCFDPGFNASTQLYPSGGYIWSPTWYPTTPPQTCDYGDDPGKEELGAALSSMDSEEYITAEAQFKEVINDFPGSPYALESVKRLIPLKRLSDNDFSGLKIYYDTTSVLHEDSLTARLIYRMENQCDVEMKNFGDAVSWYENDIQYPLSLEDSVYSLIDLSDTYLLMAADSNMKSSHASYTGTLAQYKPKDITEHTQHRYEWFKLLFKNESSKHDSSQNESLYKLKTMIQIFPNPFSNKTELSFTLSEESQVTVIITNLLGQIVQKLERSFKNEGKHSLILDLTGKPDGIYFITLYANNKEIGTLKALKIN